MPSKYLLLSIVLMEVTNVYTQCTILFIMHIIFFKSDQSKQITPYVVVVILKNSIHRKIVTTIFHSIDNKDVQDVSSSIYQKTCM